MHDSIANTSSHLTFLGFSSNIEVEDKLDNKIKESNMSLFVSPSIFLVCDIFYRVRRDFRILADSQL